MSSIIGSSFLRIILSPTSERFSLPKGYVEKNLKFVKNLKRGTSVKLESKNGFLNTVSLILEGGVYYFGNGWSNFIKDNSVNFGDILVFDLLATAPKIFFKVYNYQPNSLIREEWVPTTAAGAYEINDEYSVNSNSDDEVDDVDDEYVTVNAGHVDVYSDDDDDDVVDSEEDGVKVSDENVVATAVNNVLFSKKIFGSHLKKMAVSKEFISQASLEKDDELVIVNKDGNRWEAILKFWGKKRNEQAYISSWSDIVKGNRIKIGDIVHLSHEEDKMLFIDIQRK